MSKELHQLWQVLKEAMREPKNARDPLLAREYIKLFSAASHATEARLSDSCSMPFCFVYDPKARCVISR